MNWIAAGVVVAAIVALGAFLRWQLGVVFDAKLGLFQRNVLDKVYVRKDVADVVTEDFDRRLQALEPAQVPGRFRRA